MKNIMANFSRILLVVVYFCIFASNVHATGYYVSPSGTASWGSCTTASTPCSLAAANANAAAGDTIYLLNGTYSTPIAPANSGTESNRITYTANNGEIATITGKDITGINLNGKSYVTVDRVNVINTYTFADLKGAKHTWILNSVLMNSTNKVSWAVGILMYNNAEYNWLANCTIGNSGYFTSNDDIGGIMNLGN
jgi:hypothetical protein